MSIPKTPAEFDYDLWTTEKGKCMVRIKATGEVTEVERAVMQVLRAEEKRLRRALSTEQGGKTEEAPSPSVLSLDVLPENIADSRWLMDSCDYAEEVSTKLLEYDLRESLTPIQYGIYQASEWGQLQGICGPNGRQLPKRTECHPAHSEKSKKYFRLMVVVR
jgi:hypothetical protein